MELHGLDPGLPEVPCHSATTEVPLPCAVDTYQACTVSAAQKVRSVAVQAGRIAVTQAQGRLCDIERS
jgi:hypothetical protein